MKLLQGVIICIVATCVMCEAQDVVAEELSNPVVGEGVAPVSGVLNSDNSILESGEAARSLFHHSSGGSYSSYYQPTYYQPTSYQASYPASYPTYYRPTYYRPAVSSYAPRPSIYSYAARPAALCYTLC